LLLPCLKQENIKNKKKTRKYQKEEKNKKTRKHQKQQKTHFWRLKGDLPDSETDRQSRDLLYKIIIDPNPRMSSSNKAKSGDRSAVTGVKMGRAAKRANDKNAECVEEFMDLVEAVYRTNGDQRKMCKELLETQESEALQAARVTRSVGCGRLQVLLQDGSEYSAPIAGTLKFKGRSSTKGDRSNCMLTGDVIVIRGGFAAGKMSASQVKRCSTIYEALDLKVPAGFFAAATGAAAEMETADVGFEFDHEAEEGEAKEEDADGGAGGGTAAAASTSRNKASKHVSVAPSGDFDIDDI
jgi:hypothetical protein